MPVETRIWTQSGRRAMQAINRSGERVYRQKYTKTWTRATTLVSRRTRLSRSEAKQDGGRRREGKGKGMNHGPRGREIRGGGKDRGDEEERARRDLEKVSRSTTPERTSPKGTGELRKNRRRAGPTLRLKGGCFGGPRVGITNAVGPLRNGPVPAPLGPRSVN